MRRLLTAVLLNVLYLHAVALGLHSVENYKALSLGRGGQTWGISLYDDEWAFFANKDGLFQYNGNEWSAFSLNNGRDVRAVYACRETGRIYVSGINEFGYFTPDSHGFMQYACLSDSLGEKAKIGNMWGIYNLKGNVYVQGDHSILIYHSDGKMTVVDAGCKLDCSNMINGVLYVGTESGFKVLMGDKVTTAYGTDALIGKRIRGILPYRNGVIVITAFSGVYYYDGSALQQIVTGAEAYMTANEVFCGAIYRNTLALGTIQAGLMVIDLTSSYTEYYSQLSGMQNNTVLSVAFDSVGDLWAGLDNGIDRVLLNMPVTSLGVCSTQLGTGYVASQVGGTMYLGTNRGLFSAPTANANLNSVTTFALNDRLKGQVWGVKNVDGDVLCMHDRGLYRIGGTAVERIGVSTGAWTVQPFPDNNRRAAVGTYDGLVIIEKDASGSWAVISDLNSLGESIYNLAIESDRYIWFIKDNEGAVRLKIDPNTLKLISQKIYSAESGLPSVKGLYVCRIGDDICFATTHGVYVYDGKTDKIIPDKSLNSRLSTSDKLVRLTTHNDYLFALTDRELIRTNLRGKVQRSSLPLLTTDATPIHMCDLLYVLDDSTVIYPNYLGYSVFNFSTKNVDAKVQRKYSHINSISLSAHGDSVVYRSNYLNRYEQLEIAYVDNSVKINYGISLTSDPLILGYRYRLNGGEWSELTKSNVKEYTGLLEGKYTFEVEAMLINGDTQSESITFQVLAPWYRSNLALTCYALLLILAIWLLYLLVNKRIAKKAGKVAAAKDAEMELQKREYEKIEAQKNRQIDALEREKLQGEIEHKSQEIANLLMSVSSKNEALINIKEELKHIYSNISGNAESRKSLLVLLSQVESSIQSDKVLERIEKEFNLVHNNFMKKLRAAYPEISTNELLMCAYIKMNLSTKEIAPLMNLSMRGVETIRYRMRKKFGLEKGDSLTEFLMKMD